MCGRFTLTVDPAELMDVFGSFTFPTQFSPRYNIAPSQPVLAIPNDAKNAADFFSWGLIPSWSRDPTIAKRSGVGGQVCCSAGESLLVVV